MPLKGLQEVGVYAVGETAYTRFSGLVLSLRPRIPGPVEVTLTRNLPAPSQALPVHRGNASPSRRDSDDCDSDLFQVENRTVAAAVAPDCSDPAP